MYVDIECPKCKEEGRESNLTFLCTTDNHYGADADGNRSTVAHFAELSSEECLHVFEDDEMDKLSDQAIDQYLESR